MIHLLLTMCSLATSTCDVEVLGPFASEEACHAEKVSLLGAMHKGDAIGDALGSGTCQRLYAQRQTQS